MKIKASLLLLWFVTAGAVAQSPLMEDLARAKSKWESRRFENYSFVISNSCSCPDPLHRGPLRIVVEEGSLRRAVYLGESRDGYTSGQSVRKRGPLRVTMPGLFKFIEQQLKRGNAAEFKIKYDDKTGHPLRFEYDDPESDKPARIEVKDLKRLNQ